MNYTPIFDQGIKEEDCLLWSIKYKEHDLCEFFRLIKQWSNIEFLFEYFESHKELLNTDYWKRNGIMSIEMAVKRVNAEIASFKKELIEANRQGAINDEVTLNKIFLNLHGNVFYIGRSTKKEQVKAKPNFYAPLLRFYGLRLEKRQILITGGGIKLTEKIQQTPGLDKEIERTILIDNILKEDGILFLP